MFKAETAVTVQKPVAEVFAFVGEDYVKNHPKWDARSVSTQMQGPMAKGATGVETRKEGPSTRAYNFEVTDFQTNKRMAFTARGGSTAFASTWVFEPAGNGTQVKMNFSLSFGGFMRLFEPLMGRSVKKEMEKSAAKMKELVEGGKG